MDCCSLLALPLVLVVILAEPAVYVLTTQIENVTTGYVKRKIVLFALSLGVGCAVTFFHGENYYSPGPTLAFFVARGISSRSSSLIGFPSLFVGIAFDAGSVASGR